MRSCSTSRHVLPRRKFVTESSRICDGPRSRACRTSELRQSRAIYNGNSADRSALLMKWRANSGRGSCYSHTLTSIPMGTPWLCERRSRGGGRGIDTARPASGSPQAKAAEQEKALEISAEITSRRHRLFNKYYQQGIVHGTFSAAQQCSWRATPVPRVTGIDGPPGGELEPRGFLHTLGGGGQAAQAWSAGPPTS